MLTAARRSITKASNGNGDNTLYVDWVTVEEKLS
jgi:hypothetical protein